MSGVAARFDRWIARLDTVSLLEASSLKVWAANSVFVGVTLALFRWEPHLARIVGMRTTTAAILYLPTLLLAVAGAAVVHASGPRPPRAYYVLSIVGTSYVQFFCASLVALSEMPGALVLGTLFALAASYHGHLFRVSFREPFLPIGSLLAIGGAMVVNRDPRYVFALAWLGLVGLTGEFVVGGVTRTREKSRLRAAAIAQALQAQALDDRNRRVEELHESLSHVVAAQHDANNALVAMLLAIDGLNALAKSEGAIDRDELYLLIQEMRDATERVGEIFEETKRRGRMSVLAGERTEVQPLVDELVSTLARRFPSVRFAVEPGERVDVVRLEGGATTLRRVIENLLVNACEGDGRRGARTVSVHVERNQTGGLLCLAIEDDGPGFSAEMLQQPIIGFSTSKAQGTGLGLFTSAKLLSAHGGRIDRANREGGGARVTVTLPIAFDGVAATEPARSAEGG